MRSIKCFVDGCKQKLVLYRVNPKGQKGVWACPDHLAQADQIVDPEVKRLTDALEEHSK